MYTKIKPTANLERRLLRCCLVFVGVRVRFDRHICRPPPVAIVQPPNVQLLHAVFERNCEHMVLRLVRLAPEFTLQQVGASGVECDVALLEGAHNVDNLVEVLRSRRSLFHQVGDIPGLPFNVTDLDCMGLGVLLDPDAFQDALPR